MLVRCSICTRHLLARYVKIIMHEDKSSVACAVRVDICISYYVAHTYIYDDVTRTWQILMALRIYACIRARCTYVRTYIYIMIYSTSHILGVHMLYRCIYPCTYIIVHLYTCHMRTHAIMYKQHTHVRVCHVRSYSYFIYIYTYYILRHTCVYVCVSSCMPRHAAYYIACTHAHTYGMCTHS